MEKLYKYILLIAFSVVLILQANSQNHIFVNHDALGSNDGTSWTDAHTSLQTALGAAAPNDQIWVATGTYLPEIEVGGTGARFKTFQLKNGVAVYGGFAGNEDPSTFDLNDRDFTANETILSGNLGGGVNVYHVFRHVNLGLNSTAFLDGFSISGGKADGSDPENKGGGMLNSGSSSGNGSSPTIRNCVFKSNEAALGGAMFNSRYCSPAIINAVFENNTASDVGGAVFINRNTTTFNGCTFRNNTAQATGSAKGGGAVHIGTSAGTEGVTFTNCSFSGNTVNKTSSGARGGAIYASVNPGFLTITGSTFQQNEAQYGGAVYHSSGSYANRMASNVKVSHSSFEQNNAMYGGAIFSDGHNTVVTSCIIRGNEATQQAGGYYSRYASSESKVINSLISGNKSALHAGGVYFNSDTTEIINTTISGNYSGERGGGISMIGGSRVAIKNAIIWGNSSPAGNQLWLWSDCTANVDFTLYENGTGDVFITSGGAVNATNSLTVNPNFVSPVTPTSGNTPNTSGNYQLQTSSPAIDAGLNSHLPSGIITDLLGNKRIVKGSINSGETIDMGAYEYDPSYDPDSIIWTGNSNTNWNNEANWLPETIPSIFNDVTIPNHVNKPIITESTFAEAKSITVDSASSITINQGGTLTVAQNLTNNGTISIKSNALGDGSLIIGGDIEGTGTYSIERYLLPETDYDEGGRYHLISSPIADATANVFAGMVLIEHNESVFGWGQSITNPAAPLIPGKGYLLHTNSSDTRTFTGTVNQGSTAGIILNRNSALSEAERGWNLIGNPYPSAIDWDATDGWDRTNVENAVYIWNNNQYASYINGLATNGGSRYIAMGQGFFVRASVDGAGISMNNNARTHNADVFLKKGPSNSFLKSTKQEPQLARVTIGGNYGSDETVVYFNADADFAYDGKHDAAKLFGSEKAPQLYTKKYESKTAINSINRHENINEMFLYLEVGANAEYVMNFSHTFGQFNNLVLKDLVENKIIQPNSNYRFNAKTTDNPRRFQFITDINAISNIAAWTHNRVLYVKIPYEQYIEKVSIYNMLGAAVLITKETETMLSHLSSGVYIVHVKTNTETNSIKIFVQ